VELTQGLHRALQRHPGKVALRHVGADGQRDYTFERLVSGIARHAAALQARGVRAGDRVALLSPNNDALVVQLFACWWLGAVACPLNVRWSVAELRHAVADCGARLLLVDASLPRATGELQDSVTVLPAEALAAQAHGLQPLHDSRTGGDSLAAILYTGGTTGRAKGVMLSHANFWCASMTRGAELNNSPESITLLVAPLFHVAGLGRLIGQSIVGGGCITMPQFRPAAAIDAIARHGITDIIVVPSMLQSLLDDPSFDPARVKSLDRIAFGAAPMPPALLDRALAAWPHAEFFQAYGLTETAGAVCINLPVNHTAQGRESGRLSSVGRAGLGAEIRIVDEQGRDVPRGTVGEIVVRGPMVTRGYWGQPDTTAAALRDGWFHTGDGGRMDADGYLTIADRLKDMVISGGENVYPAEVEAALRSHAAVGDAAVIGIPDERWGESVHAVVVLRASHAGNDRAALRDELTAWCRRRLAGYKCPRSIEFSAALPLSAAGKVLKNELRAAARKALA
jgi:long-chain acyl-CoA synthetase